MQSALRAPSATQHAPCSIRRAASVECHGKNGDVVALFRGAGLTVMADGQKCNVRPYADSTASCIVSLIVGWGNTVRISSASVLSSVRAMV